MEWITGIFQSPEFGLAILPASFLLGLLTSVGSCCNIGLVGAIAGYAGSRDDSFGKRDAVLTSLFFFIGTIASLAALGMLVGYFGKFAGGSLGKYGIVLAAFASIAFGLFTLNLVPFKLPSFDLVKKKRKSGWLGASIFGLVVGMASITVTVGCCGPLMPVVLGAAAARGQGGWGALILTAFAIGYSLPLALLMLGVGMGRVTLLMQKALKPVRMIAGAVLISVGFWLLATL